MLMWGWEACHPEDMTSLTGTGVPGPQQGGGEVPGLGDAGCLCCKASGLAGSCLTLGPINHPVPLGETHYKHLIVPD